MESSIREWCANQKKHAWIIYSHANMTTYRLNADYVTDLSKQAAAGQSSNVISFPHCRHPDGASNCSRLLSPPRASIRQSRINPECDFPNVFERLIRRKQLHERPCPHVPIEPRERV